MGIVSSASPHGARNWTWAISYEFDCFCYFNFFSPRQYYLGGCVCGYVRPYPNDPTKSKTKNKNGDGNNKKKNVNAYDNEDAHARWFGFCAGSNLMQLYWFKKEPGFHVKILIFVQF